MVHFGPNMDFLFNPLAIAKLYERNEKTNYWRAAVDYWITVPGEWYHHSVAQPAALAVRFNCLLFPQKITLSENDREACESGANARLFSCFSAVRSYQSAVNVPAPFLLLKR